MSSANRGRERNKDDLYETPHWLVEAIVPFLIHHFHMLGIENPVIWEPCAGNGRITRVLKHYFPKAEIIASDIQEYPSLTFVGDFLAVGPREDRKVDLIITNPPFCLAEEICRHAEKFLSETGLLVVLERLNFLGSKQREPWLTKDTPSIYFSPRRASFLPTRQADSVEYAWFVWHQHKQFLSGHLTYLPTMSCTSCALEGLDLHYSKICRSCNYGYCKDHFVAHDCKLFGLEFLWGCYNHPDIPMVNACAPKGKIKGCAKPFCQPCWDEHQSKKKEGWRCDVSSE